MLSFILVLKYCGKSKLYVYLKKVCTILYLTYLKETNVDFHHDKNFIMVKKLKETPTCSVDYAFRRIGGKYKGRIMWHLHMKHVLRYGELKRTLPDITTKMLNQTLSELEEDELIIRNAYHEVPPKVEYNLSDVGKELIPIIEHLKTWGDKKMKEKK